jgi:hypothetical protein
MQRGQRRSTKARAVEELEDAEQAVLDALESDAGQEIIVPPPPMTTGETHDASVTGTPGVLLPR